MAQITQRGTNTWQVRVFLGLDKDGRRKTFSKTIHGTKAAARALAAKLETERDNLGTLKFEAAWQKYVAYCEHRLAKNTLDTIYSHSKHFTVFFAYNLDEIRPYIVQAWVDELSTRYKHNFVKSIVARLKAFFNYCERLELLRISPCHKISIPFAESRKKTNNLTSDEFKRFLSACENSKYGLFFRLMALTGLRTGEMRALCWDCVDFTAGTVEVKRDCVSKGGTIQDRVKTPSSYRTIKLDKLTLHCLQKLRLRYPFGNIIFKGRIDDKPISSMALAYELKKVLHNANIERDHFRIYDLRHTCASYLVKAGVPISAIADRLGHSTPATTLKVYVHASKDMEDPIIDALQELDKAE